MRRSRHTLGAALAALALGMPSLARADWGANWGTLIWGGTPQVPLPAAWGGLLAALLVLAGAAALARRGGRHSAALLLALLAPLAAVGTTISIPYVFSNGTVADAGQVNADFGALVMESNAQHSRIATLETTNVTSINAGLGLTGGGSSGMVTLDVNTSVIQQRVTGSCAPGSYVRAVDAAGGVTCQTDLDTNTTYTAGTGLSLAGTTFNVNTAAIQSRVTGTCPVNSSIRVVDAAGNVTCEADTDTDTTCATPGTCATVYGSAYAYPSAQTRSVEIGPERMIHRAGGLRSMPVAGGQWYVLNASASLTGTERYMDAGITEIPNGATVTGMSCFGYDALSTYEIGINLYECTGGNCTTRLSTDWCYSGGSCLSNLANAPGGITLAPALTPFLWQTSTSSYHISYFTSITGGVSCAAGCRLYSCTLSYTVPGPT